MSYRACPEKFVGPSYGPAKSHSFLHFFGKKFYFLPQLPVRSGKLGIGDFSNFPVVGRIGPISRTYRLSAMANFLKKFLRVSLESGWVNLSLEKKEGGSSFEIKNLGNGKC
ncbi:unnamed protein product [Meloidogyne enterolobii]|uniref:Uncharacterized protein n=2 Tax=Meloidogyne enterolobii TaxID=390850 RepID=A0ACB0YKZ9_MELEN|nr:unnamed protein product [Meloidogyne enterolobii]